MTDAGRPTRAETERLERRRKPGSLVHAGTKLGVNEEMLDRSKYAYRFVNDTPGRVEAMYANDWDPVSGEGVKPDADGLGSVVEKVVGVSDGRPVKGVLMRKRREWFEADRAEKQKPLDEMDEAIRRGVNHQKDSPELANGVGYTPGGQNTLSTPRRRG